MADSKVALITGVSSGIGNATAILLAQKGYKVFGTARNPATADFPADVGVVRLDIRDPKNVQAAVEAILRDTGRVDVLVNNAGYSLVGALEETTIDEAKALFETNFYGAVRVINAVLPAMRKQRSGRIINISSVLGFLPAPYMGFYAASKHALEGYSETLDHEVRPFGIRVALVEPSFTKTNIGAHAIQTVAQIDDYQQLRARVGPRMQERISNGEDPKKVARTVVKAVEARLPRRRYPVEGEAALLHRLRRFVPESIFDKSFRKDFRIDFA